MVPNSLSNGPAGLLDLTEGPVLTERALDLRVAGDRNPRTAPVKRPITAPTGAPRRVPKIKPTMIVLPATSVNASLCRQSTCGIVASPPSRPTMTTPNTTPAQVPAAAQPTTRTNLPKT